VLRPNALWSFVSNRSDPHIPIPCHFSVYSFQPARGSFCSYSRSPCSCRKPSQTEFRSVRSGRPHVPPRCPLTHTVSLGPRAQHSKPSLILSHTGTAAHVLPRRRRTGAADAAVLQRIHVQAGESTSQATANRPARCARGRSPTDMRSAGSLEREGR
jgi:hypothetical protein